MTDPNILADVRALIIDMDGVLWAGDQPMPGLAEFFQTLRRRSMRFVLATNNALKTPDQYVSKLASMGVRVAHDEIIGSGLAAALYLKQHARPGARVFPIGGDGVRQALINNGFQLVGLYEKNADYVVCGMDHELSWDKIATATLNIREGAHFIGTNPDTSLPTEHGLTHGNGAILAALQTATGVAPFIIGKPEPIMYRIAMERLKANAAETVAVGDRLDTDILGAVRTGIRSILVLTGASRREHLAQMDYEPTWVMQDIREITALLA